VDIQVEDVVAVDSAALLEALNNALADVADAGRRSLVRISSGQGRAQGNGSGTIWHSDGLIVTNAHVVARGSLEVTLPDGRTLPAKVLAADEELDLAALYVEASDLPTIEISDAKEIVAGQWVLALGHPWGIPGGATAGTVIGAGRELPDLPIRGREWVVLDLHLRPGHSGGPVLDSDGKLIGINTMITGPDVGFAIPVQVVKAFLKRALGTPVHDSVVSPHIVNV